jgi:hypothetical protein
MAGLPVVAEGAPAVILLVIPPRATPPQDRTVSAGRHTGLEQQERHTYSDCFACSPGHFRPAAVLQAVEVSLGTIQPTAAQAALVAQNR